MRTNILQIIPELETGGAELSTVEIATAVVRAGGRAIVLSEGGRMVGDILAAGGEFVPFPAARITAFIGPQGNTATVTGEAKSR